MSYSVSSTGHLPVMAREIAEILVKGSHCGVAEVEPGDPPGGGRIYVDATLGGGGHTLALLKAAGPEAQVVAIDRDDEAISRAKTLLEEYGDRVIIVRENFRNIKNVLKGLGIEGVDGIAADIGLSSIQLDDPERGFSFRFEAPLDMRMDKRGEKTAFDLVNELDARELEEIFRYYGEERFSRRIARAIVRRREESPVKTTAELKEIITTNVPPSKTKKIDPATRVFQALRIAVNDELESLKEFMEGAVDCLKPGGRLAVISFHSLEDRIVKKSFNEMAKDCVCPPRIPVCICDHRSLVRVVTKKGLKPSEEEVTANPRARSARLRAAEKLEAPV